jgi:hypothetical protein
VTLTVDLPASRSRRADRLNIARGTGGVTWSRALPHRPDLDQPTQATELTRAWVGGSRARQPLFGGLADATTHRAGDTAGHTNEQLTGFTHAPRNPWYIFLPYFWYPHRLENQSPRFERIQVPPAWPGLVWAGPGRAAGDTRHARSAAVLESCARVNDHAATWSPSVRRGQEPVIPATYGGRERGH